MPSLSAILDSFQPSAISEIFSLCNRLRAEGRDILDLSIGEPDFDTPGHVKEAAIKAIRDGVTKYTSVDGTSDLREAICEKFRRDNGLEFHPDQILVDSGVKPLLFHAMRAVLGPGDEALLPVPCWASYTGMVALTGARPVQVPCPENNGFLPRPSDLAEAISPRTRLVLLNFPSNPTGAACSAADLRGLADVLREHPELWILSDDIYEHIRYDGREFVTLAQVAPDLGERTLTCNGVSKAYAMTGWRIGYLGGPGSVVGGIRKVLSQSTGSPPSVSQAAAVAALTGPQDLLGERAQIFQRRRDTLVPLVRDMPGLRCTKPQGAFYLYVNCAGLIGKRAPSGQAMTDSTTLARYLLEAGGVALVPGRAFESDPYLRVSYAASTEVLLDAARRLADACGALD